MSQHVQRFVARVKPAPDHPKFYEWQTATFVVLVGEDDRVRAQAAAEREIKRRRWQRIEFTDRARIIEARAREQGGEFWDAYLQAKSGKLFVLENLDTIPFSTKENGFQMRVPRLGEAFIDKVVEKAGGARLSREEANFGKTKNADYRVGRFILELKDLQSEGLEVKARQKRIAELFRPKLQPDSSVGIEPKLLSESELEQYLEIVGTPIRKRLDSARSQVRSTLDHLGDEHLRGGAILLNTGYGTMPPDLLYSLAKDYIARSETLQLVICISAWTLTDGFDIVAQFKFNPDESELHPTAPLRNAFSEAVNELMTQWVRSGCDPGGEAAEPLAPLVFEDNGGTFAIVTPRPPSSLPGRDRSNDDA